MSIIVFQHEPCVKQNLDVFTIMLLSNVSACRMSLHYFFVFSKQSFFLQKGKLAILSCYRNTSISVGTYSCSLKCSQEFTKQRCFIHYSERFIVVMDMVIILLMFYFVSHLFNKVKQQRRKTTSPRSFSNFFPSLQGYSRKYFSTGEDGCGGSLCLIVQSDLKKIDQKLSEGPVFKRLLILPCYLYSLESR